MDSWKTWPDRARLAKIQSGKADVEIAATVTEITKRKAGRAQVNHWFTGKREPTISQFMAVCEEIGADPGAILFDTPIFPQKVKDKRTERAPRSDPRTRPSYAMEEKRLKMRRHPITNKGRIRAKEKVT